MTTAGTFEVLRVAGPPSRRQRLGVDRVVVELNFAKIHITKTEDFAIKYKEETRAQGLTDT